MNNTPRSERTHIALFGRRNAGKSSLINAITNQNISLVSDVLGTTTDPVLKSMEILPIGPVVIIDTAGLDDDSELGKLRIDKTIEILNKTDIAIIVIDINTGITEYDNNIISLVKKKEIPFIIVMNKIDTIKTYNKNLDYCYVSSVNKEGIPELLERIANKYTNEYRYLIQDKLQKDDIVILVTPIDSAAPKGRMILPQMQVLRDILDSDATAFVCKETELEITLKSLSRKPKLVITDSQAFNLVKDIVPSDILLTSFSIIYARYKGDLDTFIEASEYIKKLKSGDKILISEGCTHHRQKDDIGKYKIPKWIEEYTDNKFKFDFSSGYGYPDNLSEYKLVIHCGACMLNRKEVLSRISKAKELGIPIINYGIFISLVNDILPRALEIF